MVMPSWNFFLYYFFSIMVLLVINSMVTMAKSFRETSIYGEFVQSGSIMERIVREIRASNGWCLFLLPT